MLQNAMTPVWLGDTVWNESVMFTPDPETGIIMPAPLLYPLEEIISVRSSDFMIEYEEGRDYYLENNCLARMASGRMPFFDRDNYFLKKSSEISIESVSCPGRFVRYDPGGVEFARRQAVVTYRHSGCWQGPAAQCRPEQLPGTLERLRNREPLRLVFYGDSVMEGCDATGKSGIAPYQPPGDELLVRWLALQYKHPSIWRINTAVGGTDSGWGRDNAGERAARYEPDLAVIGFGMNDGSRKMPVDEYSRNITAIIEIIRNRKPEVEFLLLSPGLPNPDCRGWTGLQAEYAPALDLITKMTPGCCHVPITAIHLYLYSKKRYGDMNGNGINHPNDFLVRLGTQAMAACLIQAAGLVKEALWKW